MSRTPYGFFRPTEGVDPDAPPKRGFIRFFEIFFRKLSTFSKANLLYDLAGLIFALPIFLGVFILTNAFIYSSDSLQAGVYSAFLLSIFITGAYISIMGIGPATAGISGIFQNFAQEKPAWLWSDFKDLFKENFKQAIAVYLTDLVVVILVYIAVMFYSKADGIIAYARYLIYGAVLVYALMHMYIYQIMVKFDFTLKQIYKNAFLLTMAELPLNLLVAVLIVLVHIALPYFLLGIAGKYFVFVLVLFSILEFFITQSFGTFMISFNAFPKLKKYMIDPAKERFGIKEVKEEPIFSDDVRERNKANEEE